MSEKPVIGIISHQPVSREMAGPSIRCWEFARALAGDFDVRLIAPESSDLDADGFIIDRYDAFGPEDQVADCDALICQGYTLSLYPELKHMGKFLVVDMYVPMALEALEQNSLLPEEVRADAYANTLTALMDQAVAGDYFICASERQRDYWLGLLTGVGRIDTEEYAADTTLRKLIDVVPFGVSETEPQATGPALKGVHPGIGAEDKLILWGGGIYNWLDPLTPINAMALLREKHPDFRMYFMGTRHPDPNVPEMRIYEQARELSDSLGLLGETIFFNDEWVSYDRRAAYLLEADVGISAHLPHIETRFSYRTRILDYIWAGLPIVASDGDVLGELVDENGLGLVAPAGDAAEFAAALEKMLEDEAMRRRCHDNLASQAEEMRWSVVTAPLQKRLAQVDWTQFDRQEHAGVEGFQQHELDRRQQEISRLNGQLTDKAADIKRLWEIVADKDRVIDHFQDVIKDKNRQLRNPLYRLKTIAANRLRRK